MTRMIACGGGAQLARNMLTIAAIIRAIRCLPYIRYLKSRLVVNNPSKAIDRKSVFSAVITPKLAADTGSQRRDQVLHCRILHRLIGSTAVFPSVALTFAPGVRAYKPDSAAAQPAVLVTAAACSGRSR